MERLQYIFNLNILRRTQIDASIFIRFPFASSASICIWCARTIISVTAITILVVRLYARMLNEVRIKIRWLRNTFNYAGSHGSLVKWVVVYLLHDHIACDALFISLSNTTVWTLSLHFVNAWPSRRRYPNDSFYYYLFSQIKQQNGILWLAESLNYIRFDFFHCFYELCYFKNKTAHFADVFVMVTYQTLLAQFQVQQSI